MGQAETTRHVVSAAGSVRLRQPTPTPDLLQAGFVENVRKLERSAEELSAGGSDIGEEIRKMNELSRQSSLQSSHHGDITVIRPSVMERMSSMQSTRRTSSRRSMDVNSLASPGPYSPNPIVWSPTTTSMSASRSQLPPSVAPPATQSSHRPQPMHSVRSTYAASEDSMRSRHVSDSSFARRYDEIAGEIQESLQHVPPSLPRDGSIYTPSEHRRSMDTFQEAQVVFMDFDGVHYSPETNEIIETDRDGNEVRHISVRSSSGRHSLAAPSLLHTSRAPPHPRVVPPPAEGMAYYPAPVPRMLNLPKRLSQLPAATVQSKRKTQMLTQMSKEAGAAAPWLAHENDTRGSVGVPPHSQAISASSGAPSQEFQNHRMSSNTLNLPPQARAELFFKYRQASRDVEMKSDSAVATLDSILEASATAPVSAFTDHPFAGDVTKSVYAIETKPQKSGGSKATNLASENNPKKRRSGSITGVLRNVLSSGDVSTMLKDGDLTPSPGSHNGAKELPKRRSCMSLDDTDLQPDLGTSALDISRGENSRQSADQPEDTEEEFREAEAQEDVEGDPVFVKPSTLLAELQVRKAQQKSRGRTAVTAFPNGMHSTLLELDAVQQISQQKRKGQRIALAWEDPSQRTLQQNGETEDDDVPLGMLLTGHDGLTSRRVGDGKDWDRPLGLIDRRNLEDEEPLSSRRNRLRGVSRSKARPIDAPELLINGREHGMDDQEEEHETLAQRLRRMKAQSSSITLEESSASLENEGLSHEFAQDVLSQFATLTTKDSSGENNSTISPAKAASSPDNEEETLGQRKARLHREREANEEQIRDKHRQTNAEADARQRLHLHSINSCTPSYNLGRPLGDAHSYYQFLHSGQLANGERVPNGGYAGSTYANGMGGMQFQPNAVLPTLGANMAPYSYAGMTAFAPAQSQAQQQWMNSASVLPSRMANIAFVGNAYHPGMANGTYAAHAQRISSGGGLGIAMNEEQMHGPNRTVIDRWRLGVP